MILAEKSDRRQALGAWGEGQAEEELRRAGLRVIERRFRCRMGELDLIALRGRMVVFVEVRTRSGGPAGEAARSVGPAKQRRLGRLALAYLGFRGWLDRPVRFDVVEVRGAPGGAPRIVHIPDAFRPGRG